MNNLLSYCGLIDAKIRASDKDLPVNKKGSFEFGLSVSFLESHIIIYFIQPILT
jgi:hypothetical protein